MDQEWFEMQHIRRRNLAATVWIPLRAARAFEHVGQFGAVGFREDWLGVGSLAVPIDNRSDALALSWDAVGYCQVEQNPPVLRKDSARSGTENQ